MQSNNAQSQNQETPFDALLLVSFGGPEASADVIPFLENVLRGRNVPRDRMLAVAEHYYLFDGVSPINEQNRNLIAALKPELELNDIRLPVYWGNRNWHPLLANTLRQMTADGIKHALAFVTTAYSSYSSCRQYLENIATARTMAGPDAPLVDKLRAFYNHPGFIEANAQNLATTLQQVGPERRSAAEVIFTAHSIPVAMAQASNYELQLNETAALVAKSAGHEHWTLVYQSRSGSPSQPWLGPDINDYLRQLKGTTITDVIIAPIGFVSDHMEVVYDLDVQARQLCEQLGMNMMRVPTAGTHPSFVRMIRELIEERLRPQKAPRALGQFGPAKNTCEADCCVFNASR